MSFLTGSRGVRRSAAVLVTALGLGAMTTLAAKPADARVFVSVGVPGWGYYHPGYWYRPYGPYYRAYYPAYYRGWQWRQWCYWHPYRCYR